MKIQKKNNKYTQECNEQRSNVITNLMSNLIRFIMVAICAYLTVTSMFTTVRLTNTEHIYFTSDNPLIHIGAIALVILITFGITRCKKEKFERYFYMVFAVATVLMISIVFTANLVPTFDQLHVSDVAVQILHHDYSSFLKGGYARLWDNQSGFIIFLSCVYRVFGEDNYIAVQLINVACYLASILLICRLVRNRLCSKDFSYVVGIVLCLFMPVWFFTTFIYGTAPALVLSLVAMVLECDFFEEKSQSIWKIIIAGILISIATILKTNALIYLLAMLVYAIIRIISNIKMYRNDAKEFVVLKSVFGFIWIVAVYLILSKGMSFAMQSITGMPDLSGTPRTAHIAMGLQESSSKSSGWFNGYNEQVYVDSGYDRELANDVAVDNIKTSIDRFVHQPSYAVGFFLKKITSQWCEPSYESLFVLMSRKTENSAVAGWLGKAIDGGFGSDALITYMNIFQTLIYFGALIYFLRGNMVWETSFPAIVVIGGFLFHLMWEANSQYILVYVILLIAYSVKGYACAADDVISIVDKRRESEQKRLVLAYSPVVFTAISSLILVVVAMAPDASFVGRAFKMNWNTEEFYRARAESKGTYGDWNIKVKEDFDDCIGDEKVVRNAKPAIKDGRYIIRTMSDADNTLIIADNGLESGDRVIVGQADENRVIVSYDAHGYVFRFQNSQKVMDIALASTEPGTIAQQWDYNGDVSQTFDIIDNSDNTYVIIYRNDLALTVNDDGSVTVELFTGEDNQKWVFDKTK